MLRTIVIILALALCSCTFEQLFPQEVANGIARLSVNNLGNLLRALSHEQTYTLEATDKRIECKLHSLDVTDKTTIFVESEGQGHVQHNFDECVYDFGSTGLKIDIPSLCGRETATLYGKVIMSGHRTMSGILTGNPQAPVIPSGDDGIQFHFSKVQFTNFRVESSTIDKAMTITSGSVAFDVTAHLAKSQTRGICEIPLPNLTLSNIQYSPGAGASETIVQLPGAFGIFSASIDSSLFEAQVGIHQGRANHLAGEITVWGKKVQVPGNDPGLNPSFSVNAYQESLSCTHDLATPVEDGCSFEPDYAGNLSRLTVLNLGNILAFVASADNQHARPECRLGNLNEPPTQEFPLDDNQAEIVWKFSDCEFEFKNQPGTEKTLLNGKVRLSGERRIKGFHLKGNQKNPVIPGKGGVHFSFSHVEFDHYSAKTEGSPAALTIAQGAAAFDAHIHVAKSKTFNICSVVLKQNPTLSNIKYKSMSKLVIGTQIGDFHVAVQDSLFNAQVGRHNGVENRLEGHITIFGKHIDFLPNSKLDPQYKESDFDDLLAKTEDLLMPLDQECEAYAVVEDTIADGIARLTINNFGRMLESITQATSNTREECQLGSGALTDRATIDYVHNTITWHFNDCEFAPGGKVKVSGTRTITGFLTGSKQNPIIPAPGSSVDFHFSKVQFDNYRAEFKPDTHLTIVQGAASFDMSVPFGRNAGTGICSVVVPNPTFKNVRYLPGSNTKVILAHEEKGIYNLEVDIKSSDFEAQFGFGKTLQDDNGLKGSISILGRTFSVPTDGLGLNPLLNHAATFEELLKKTPNLASTDRERIYQCETFERVRALNIARLMILNTGSVTQESYDEYLKSPNFTPNCGFSSNRVRMFGKRHSGLTGQVGELHFNVSNCPVVNQPNRGLYEKDCLGEKTVFEGKATISGTQKVKGILGTYWGFNDIMPNSPQAISFDFDSITLEDFVSYYVKDDNDIPPFKLKVSGTMDAQVRPILSPKKGRPCEFFRSTPVVSFDLHAKNEIKAYLELQVDNFSYASDVTIYAMNIKAQNGVFQGKGNSITGEININHKTFYFDNELLNPYYDQERFDQSYKCRELYAAENEYSLEYVIPHWEGWQPDCKL